VLWTGVRGLPGVPGDLRPGRPSSANEGGWAAYLRGTYLGVPPWGDGVLLLGSLSRAAREMPQISKCSGRFVGESRIGTGVGSDVSSTAESWILFEGLSGNQSVLSGSLRGLQNLKDQRRRVVWYLALVHVGMRRRRGRRLLRLLRRCSSVGDLE
jgi:hypothetical protein